MKFPRAVKLIGKPKFEVVFIEELQQQVAKVPIQDLCGEGFPDEDSVEVELVGITPTRNGCRVRISATFDETVTTGCSAITMSRGGGILVGDIALERGSAETEVEIDHEASTSAGSREDDY